MGDPPPIGARKRALVIEDDALIAMDLEEMLRQLGFEDVETAVNTEEIEAASGHRFDVVVADLHLGSQSSAPHLRVFAESGTPLIICSGAVPSAETKAFPRSVALDKPYTMGELQDALRSVGAL